MKNVSLILNVILLVAVAVLFYLHFSGTKTTAQPKIASSTNHTATAGKGDFKIAYFEMDSVNNNFVLIKDVKSELSKEEEKINSELTRLQKSYNDRITHYQGQANSMSQVESENANRDILQLQDKIRTTKQTMESRYQDLYMRKMQDVKLKVEDYLKEYNSNKGYSYILAYEPGFIFYRDSALNITSDLINGLNAKYKKK
ncbi:MAG: OmpH family outer membrane protein [Chitinophagaceae bacterium]|nr:MAG: OmpH family outer membrane protein [Chitinophagaceae bacterium]